MDIYSSGNKAVDEMAVLNISGNITPISWYKTILKETNRPYLLAIAILSDIVYWFKPVEIRDEVTGKLIGYKKKFSEDTLYKTYQSYANLFGEPKTAVKNAFDRLVEYGIIIREFRNVEQDNGTVLYNMMFITLNVEKLREFTYPSDDEPEGKATCGQFDHKLENIRLESADTKAFIGGTPEKSPTSPRKLGEVMEKAEVPPTVKLPTYTSAHGEVTEQTWVSPSENSGTNTENTTENTTEITSTSPAPFDDESVRAVFAGLNLNDHDICCIISASEDNLEKCRKAVEALKKQKTKISNVTGWLINAVRQNFEVSNWVGYKPRNNQAGSFGNFQQREIDFDELYKRIYAN